KEVATLTSTKSLCTRSPLDNLSIGSASTYLDPYRKQPVEIDTLLLPQTISQSGQKLKQYQTNLLRALRNSCMNMLWFDMVHLVRFCLIEAKHLSIGYSP